MVNSERPMIPKILHIVWVGDQKLKPVECIESWRQHNPSYELVVWDNDAFAKTPWHNIAHIYDMIPRELNGVADIMRYEILFNMGGIALDADSYCVRSLEDWLLEPNEFAVWENELARPGLIGCNALGSQAGSPFFGKIIEDISKEETVINNFAWKTVGPLRVTNAYRKYRHPLTIYPSHYFAPNHFDAPEYSGTGPVFAKQLWGSTTKSYQKKN